MKKLLFIALMLGVFITSSFSQDRTGLIRTGGNIMNRMVFSDADSIVTSDSLVIQITNINKYLQHQALSMTLDDVDGGSPSVLVTLRGRYTNSGTWHPIGSAVTWTGEGSNPIEINSTTPLNYNYLKVSLVASGATQHSHALTLDIRTTNVFDIGASAAYVFGNGAGTVTINSSDWDVSATGAMTGIGAITSNGLITTTAGVAVTGAISNVNVSSNFATNLNTGTSSGALTLGGGSGTVAVNSSGWDITTAGVTSGLLHSIVANTDASETLTAAQSGAFVVCSNAAGATTITLPDPSAGTVGVIYYLLQTADQNLIATATTANGNSIVCDGVATTDNVTISTASHKIGAGMIIIGISATQWYIGGLNPESVLTPEVAD